MDHFMGISFWILTFLSGLQAAHLPLEDASIWLMRRDVTCPPDSKFYTPTDVVRECIPTALDCVLRELNGTVAKECPDPHERVDEAVEFMNITIQYLGEGRATTTSSECTCEKWSQTAFSKFLDNMESLLELHYATSSE